MTVKQMMIVGVFYSALFFMRLAIKSFARRANSGGSGSGRREGAE
jgi:hypothetical protein